MVNVYIAVIQKEQGVTFHLQPAAKPHRTYYLLHITYYFPKIPLPILFWGKSEEVRGKSKNPHSYEWGFLWEDYKIDFFAFFGVVFVPLRKILSFQGWGRRWAAVIWSAAAPI